MKKKKMKVYNVKVKNDIKTLCMQVKWSDSPYRRVTSTEIHVMLCDAFAFKLFCVRVFVCLPMHRNTSILDKDTENP